MTEQRPDQWSGYRRTIERFWARRPSNPNVLMRRCDRIDAAVRITALVLALLMVPVAGTVGTLVYSGFERRVAAAASGPGAGSGTAALTGIGAGVGFLMVCWMGAGCLAYGSARWAEHSRDRYWERQWRRFTGTTEGRARGDAPDTNS
ncbi:hypothetical protein [Nocardia sp. NPDC003345]